MIAYLAEVVIVIFWITLAFADRLTRRPAEPDDHLDGPVRPAAPAQPNEPVAGGRPRSRQTVTLAAHRDLPHGVSVAVVREDVLVLFPDAADQNGIPQANEQRWCFLIWRGWTTGVRDTVEPDGQEPGRSFTDRHAALRGLAEKYNRDLPTDRHVQFVLDASSQTSGGPTIQST